jgi:dUTP pyrophosphatase
LLLKIKKVKEYNDLPTPKYMTNGSAGLDLYAAIERPITIKTLERLTLPTGICIELTKGYEAQIRPRSGLASKHGITLLNSPGTVDWDYRGEIKVILVNLSVDEYTINRGDRIAQMVINKIEKPIIEIVENIDETKRGSNGFGSTGV